MSFQKLSKWEYVKNYIQLQFTSNPNQINRPKFVLSTSLIWLHENTRNSRIAMVNLTYGKQGETTDYWLHKTVSQITLDHKSST